MANIAAIKAAAQAYAPLYKVRHVLFVDQSGPGESRIPSHSRWVPEQFVVNALCLEYDLTSTWTACIEAQVFSGAGFLKVRRQKYYLSFYLGAGRGGRTPTTLRSADFESFKTSCNNFSF